MALAEVQSLESFLDELLPAETAQDAGEMLSALAVLDGGGKMKPLTHKRGRPSQKTTNSERCRRYRLKRQKEEEKLVYDNLNLKRERRALKKQFDTLQREVNELIRLGDKSLHMENERLRKELLGHQLYLDKVVSAIRSPFPFETAVDRQYRALHDGIDNAVNLVVGTMYNSMCDSTWKVGKPFELQSGMFCRWMYQLLPLGSSVTDATRVNIRLDLENLPYPAKVLETYVWQYMKNPPSSLDPDLPADTYNQKYWFNHVLCEDIRTPRLTENKLECSRIIIPKERPEKEVIVLHSTKEVDIYPMAYLQDCRLAQTSQPILSSTRCNIVVSTNLQEDVCIPGHNSKLERLDTGFSKGTAIKEDRKDVDNPCSRITHLMSMAMNNGYPALAGPGFEIIESSGELSKLVLKIWRSKMRSMMKGLQQFPGKSL